MLALKSTRILKNTVVSVGMQLIGGYNIPRLGVFGIGHGENFYCKSGLFIVRAFVPVNMEDIRFIRSLTDQLVVQGRDHADAHIHVFCPVLYHHVLRITFGDPNLYNKRNMTPTAAQKHLSDIANSKWLKRYRWGIQPHVIHSSQSQKEVPRRSTYYQLSSISFRSSVSLRSFCLCLWP